MPSTPTPIPAPPSSALHMTQINALNKQIQELLAKNVELRRDLDAERLRGEKVVSEIAQRSKEEVTDVKAVAEMVTLVSKTAHLDTLWMAGEERWKVLCAVDDIRKERIERTKVEFRILQFQVRERELEYRIEYLQDQLDNILERLNAAEQLHQDQMGDLSEQYNSSFSAVETRLVSLSATLKSTRIERDSLATQLTILKSSNTSIQISLNDSKKESDSFQRNIERLKLELEGKDRDAKEMRGQLKGWQRLEGKGNEEIDAERAKRVGLEVELKVEKDRVKEGKKRIKELLSEFEATQAELKEAQIEIESLKVDIEKAVKVSMKVKRTLVQAQADAEEEQKAAAKRKRLAEDGLDEPVTKKVKKRQPPLRSNSSDVCSTPSGHGHEPSPPPVPRPKKFHEKKPVVLPIYDVASKPVKKDKNANSQPLPDGDEREEPGAQVARPKLTEKKKSPLSKTTQAKVKPIGTIPPQEEQQLKTPTEHADTVAPTKPKKKVNLRGGRGLLAGFGGLGGIGASSITWGGEMARSNEYGIPPTLSSPIKASRDEAAEAPQGSMFTFGANK